MGVAKLSVPSVIVNNESIFIVPNSLSYNEGKGEQKVFAVSAGGGRSSTVYAKDAEMLIGKVKFQLQTDEESVKKARAWKSAGNNNAVRLTAPGFSRTFQNMALVNDYEVNMAADGVLDLEFHGDPAI